MNRRNVRRTNAPAPTSGFATAKLLRRAALVLPFVVVMPFAWHVFIPAAEGDVDTEIEAMIRKAGFNPLIPPNRLRAPGALYTVEDDFYQKICEDSALAGGMTSKSPTTNRMRERLQQNKFSLAGGIVDALNAKLEGTHVTSIQYTLSNVEVSEITVAGLKKLRDKLLGDSDCAAVVDELLKDNKKVCFAISALSATTSYTMQVHHQVDLDAQAKTEHNEAIKQAVQEQAGGQLHAQSKDELTGVDLFIGIRLQTRCLTPGDATDPVSSPPVLPTHQAAALP
jgi:hypothetical protein